MSPKNRANTFICAMGGWFWLDKDGEHIPNDCKYLAPVENIFDRYNEYFNLYGAGFWDRELGAVGEDLTVSASGWGAKYTHINKNGQIEVTQ